LALAGSQVDAALLGSSKNRQGARLKDLSVTASLWHGAAAPFRQDARGLGDLGHRSGGTFHHHLRRQESRL
jgi:hypothetical protein